MRPLSLAALTILDAGPAGQMRAAAAAGWSSVGLRLQPLVETDEIVVGRPEREREIRRLRSETGLRLLEVGVFPMRPDFRFADFTRALDFAAELGAAFAVAPVEDPDPSRRAGHFARFAEAARAVGLRALVEFNPYSACASLGAAIALLDLAAAPGAALCLDALHLFRSGGAPADLRKVAPDRFALLHFCDAAPALPGADEEALRRESRTARRLPGEGALPLGALLDALPPDVPISLEAPSPRLAGLAAEDRARLALEATRRWLDARETPH
jgi:sugar phosphate isomerase/epimerase